MGVRALANQIVADFKADSYDDIERHNLFLAEAVCSLLRRGSLNRANLFIHGDLATDFMLGRARPSSARVANDSATFVGEMSDVAPRQENPETRCLFMSRECADVA